MDRRVKKTNAAIRKAFTTLLMEKGDANDITIKEIVDCADISRSTFYSHYSDIYELTADICQMLAEDISKIVIDTHKRTSGKSSYRIIYKEILTHLYDKGPIAKALLVDMRNTQIVRDVSDTIRDNIAEYYISTNKSKNPELLRAAATFWTNGVLGLMREWVKNDFNCPIDTATEIIVNSIDTCATFFKDK